ncbi:MAG TPA: histidine kinase [Actinomycetota bacterium]|nr:histidine kinase [Actinomycetota bacterium]
MIAGIAMRLAAVLGEALLENAMFILAFGMFGVVGALILSRDGRNLIGILLLYGSSSTAVAFCAGVLTTARILDGHAGALTAAVALVGSVGWLFGIVPVLLLLLLLFPDGHLPSPRWRPVVWFIAAVGASVLLSTLFGAPTLSGSNEAISMPNPWYSPTIERSVGWVAEASWTFIVIVALALAAIVVRFRRSRGVERQQMKWFAAAAVFVFVSSLVTEAVLAFAPELEGVDSVISGLAFFALPVSVGVAVLRYRLYDLDVVVRKTLVYAALAVFATAVYVAIVVGAGWWLGRNDSFLTMVAAVVVALTFQPVRTRLTHVANRLVYGRRATPYEVLADFSQRVGATYGDDDVLARMARVLGEGVGADRADVWLKVDADLRNVAVWPGDTDRLAPVALSNGHLPSIGGAERVYAVEHGGELLGALAIRKPPADPVSPADDKLVADLAQQAGLVLRNVRLTEELRARLDDLRAAQKRLVQAQDEARRRLERNIHDGAQQQLVALAVKARLARSLTERDPAKAGEMLDQIAAETGSALEDLRELARGIYPPLLADEGLAAAIVAQARKSPLDVEVQVDGVARYPADVEAAVYFSCLEALQNAAKYADARRVIVALRERGGHLTFTVADDGRGFDPATTGYGTGLQGIADRLVAIDGTLDIRSEPGGGTTVAGVVPVAATVAATVGASGPGRSTEA